ncbi:MAG: hypothetical protein BGO14_00980 [Chlamydiales bacterium 38-26]|nr:hypothetical protein [Chlamydiales bacterium]OJV07295.1 MAG: hypothetical protein BGO14_00980 [Chlamydiales bacterium 38-26]
MKDEFNNLYWHDAILESFYLDRSNPGHQDTVKLLIEWPEGKKTYLEFFDCYELQMEMNFGIVANESILTAECITESEEIEDVREKWQKMGVDLKDLKCFFINTNSTNSILKIFALNFRMQNFE